MATLDTFSSNTVMSGKWGLKALLCLVCTFLVLTRLRLDDKEVDHFGLDKFEHQNHQEPIHVKDA